MSSHEACIACGCVEHEPSIRYVRGAYGQVDQVLGDDDVCVMCGRRWRPVELCDECERSADDCACEPDTDLQRYAGA